MRIQSNIKILIVYNFFERKIFAFMTFGQFLPRNNSLRFVVQDSRVQGRPRAECEALEPLNLSLQISNSLPLALNVAFRSFEPRIVEPFLNEQLSRKKKIAAIERTIFHWETAVRFTVQKI